MSMSLPWGHATNPIGVFTEIILPLTLVWGVGFLGRRFLDLDPRPFARAGIYLLSPILIFTLLMSSQITAEEGSRIILVVFLLCGGLWVLCSVQAWLLHLSQEDRSAFMLSAIFLNAVNYGYPVVLLSLGQSGLERAVVFSLAATVLTYTVGVYIAARGRAGGVKDTIYQLLRIPMLYAVLLAFLLRAAGFSANDGVFYGIFEIRFLSNVYSGIKMLAQAAVPIFMLVLGMQLGTVSDSRKDIREPRGLWPLTMAGLTRLVLSPVLALALTRLVGLEELAARPVILEAAMPTAVNTLILATEFETRPQFVTKVIVGTTLFSMVTLTLLLSTWN
jgi:predicted permease